MTSLEDRIKAAPKGSRLRAILDDSSTEDDSEVEVLSSGGAGENPDDSQATWTGTQPTPPGIQTQPEPQKRDSHESRGLVQGSKALEEWRPTPIRRMPSEVVIADTPEGHSTLSSITNSMLLTTTSERAKRTEEETKKLFQQDLQTLEKNLMKKYSDKSVDPANRVSMSPPGKQGTKVKTPILGLSKRNSSKVISTLEALDPPALSEIMNAAAEEKSQKRKSESNPQSEILSAKQEGDSKPEKVKAVNVPMKPDTSLATSAINSDAKPTRGTAKEVKHSAKKQTRKRPQSDVNQPSTGASTKSGKKGKVVKQSNEASSMELSEKAEKAKPSKATNSAGKENMVDPKRSKQEEEDKRGKKDPTAAKTSSPNHSDSQKPLKSDPQGTKKRTFQDKVLAEMLFSCKVYSLKTLAHSLNTTETALHHLMLSLVDKKIVLKKEFSSKSGKTKELYWANQDSTAKEIAKLVPAATEVEEAKKEHTRLKMIEAENAKTMALITKELSNREVDSRLAELEYNVSELRNKVKAIRTRMEEAKEQSKDKLGARKVFKKGKCPQRLKMRINQMRAEWKSRKEKCMDFIDQLADGMEKKPKEIIKLLELETDEMVGVTIPPKHVIESGRS